MKRVILTLALASVLMTYGTYLEYKELDNDINSFGLKIYNYKTELRTAIHDTQKLTVADIIWGINTTGFYVDGTVIRNMTPSIWEGH